MALDVEGVVDRGVGGEEFLGGSLGFEPLLLSLSSSDRQVGILDPVVLAQSSRTMKGLEPKLPKGRSVRRQAVCGDPFRLNRLISQEPTQKYKRRLMEKAIARVEAIVAGDPLDPDTMVGAQASDVQLKKILGYLEIGRAEGAEVLTGGDQPELSGDLAGGYYVKPTIFKGRNDMRVFQEEIFGPVLSVTTFKTFEEAIEIANDTIYGLGAGVWSRDMNTAYRAGRGIEAGRVWTNCYHQYPAHAAFGGYKKSGIGRENHRMMLDHYQQTKNLLVSYSPDKLGFF